MKKWVITILLAVTLLALALATHFWGASAIKFAVDNDKTVDSIKKLLELLLAIGGLVPPVVKWLFSENEKASKAAPAVTESQIVHDLNVAGGDIQIGGVSTTSQGPVSIGGHVAGRDINIYESHASTFHPSLYQLPPPPADFTGRTAELQELRDAIKKGGFHISGLQGQGGVGKTALALKLAEELASTFPDAQIYLDLKGVSENPLTSAEAMSHVLRAFHPEAKLPEKEEEIRALYLSVLHNKRALLLMDNAKDAAQVKPLIPPPGCALLVTSRQHFAMPGLQAKNLETLPPPDAKELLLLIAPRIAGEAEAIAKLCGYLPQALRLAASAIAVRVNLEPQDYARQLADEKKRLELLADDDESVTASITMSYNLLDVETQARWRLLAVFPDTFDPSAAAAIWEMENVPAQETFSRLLQFSMLEWNSAAKRCRLHDLMRDFVRQRWTPSESDTAARRHALYYGAALLAVDDLYLEGGDSINSALGLLDVEWRNIQAGQSWVAAHSEEDRLAAELCDGYAGWGQHAVLLRQHPHEQIRWLEAALASARQLGNRPSEGRHLGGLGVRYHALGDYRRTIEYSEKALGILIEIGDTRGVGAALGNLGAAHESLGHYDRAIEYHEKTLAINRETGDLRGESHTLNNLGVAHKASGDYRRAIEHYQKSLAIAREIADLRSEGISLGNLGNLYSILGEPGSAVECYEQGLTIARDLGDRHSEGSGLWNEAMALDQLGDRRQAIEHAEAAVKIFEELEDPNVARAKKHLEILKSGGPSG